MSTDAVHRTGATTDFDRELITRYTFAERINHWVGALTYIFCLMTGLAFWSPYLYWLAAVVGGGPTARFAHPWAGLLFTASYFWTCIEWHRDMEIDADDNRWAHDINVLHQQRRRQASAGGPFQLGPKTFLLGDVLEHDSPATLRVRTLVHRRHFLEISYFADGDNSRARQRGTHHHRAFF